VNEVELTVDRIAVGGKGLGLDTDGRATFVAGSIPTERVVAKLTKQKKRFAEGEAVRVLSASTDRVTPPCPHTVGEQRCGGCDWQFVSAEGQRRLRVALVEDSLRRIGKLDTSQIAIASGPALPLFGYRTAVRMLVGPDGRLAYRQRGTNRGFVPPDCGIVHPDLEALIIGVRCPGASEASLRVSQSSGEASIVVDAAPDRVVAPGHAVVSVAGDRARHITETIDGVDLQISAGAFFQSSAIGAELLVAQVRHGLEGVDQTGVLVDAYSGGGLFTATIGRQWHDAGGRVLAVESSPAAVADARINAPFAEHVESRVEAWQSSAADAVIADPARSGLESGGVETVVETGATRVVLVSCDAGALGRDAGLLCEAGYRITNVVVLDLFNQTSHVEVVTTFER